MDSMDMNLCKLWKIAVDREPCCAAVHAVKKGGTQLSDGTTANRCEKNMNEGYC